MAISVIDLENKLSSLIDSFNILGINIEQIHKGFKAHMAAKYYLRNQKNDIQNDLIAKKQDIINSTKEDYKRYKKVLYLQNKIKKKLAEEVLSSTVNSPTQNDQLEISITNHNNTEQIVSQQNETNIDNENHERNKHNNRQINDCEYNDKHNNIRSNNNHKIETEQQEINNDLIQMEEIHVPHNDEHNDIINNNDHQIETEQQEINNDSIQTEEIQVLQNSQCQNCKRRQHVSLHDKYKLQFFTVNSNNIRRRGDFKLVTAYTGERAVDYVICKECKSYLEEKNNDPKNIWPSFYWLLLTGSHNSSFNGTIHHHSIYEGNVLWMFIPQQMRYWWIDEILAIAEHNNSFESITILNPPSIFEDKTIALSQFNDDFSSGQLSNIVNAMNNENIINANILCPWSCSTNYSDSGKIPLDLMIQRMLTKINLKIYTDVSQYRQVHSCWDQYFRENNDYPSILLNKKWPIKPSVVMDDNGVHVLTCKHHNGGHDKLTLYPPQSPNHHILNAQQSDQLTHCVQIPRVTKPIKPMKYSTKFAMVQCRSGYSGIDTMNITTHSDFSKTSELLSLHEDASIIGRKDIRLLLNLKVANKQISPELAESFVTNAKRRFNIDEIREHTQGSTYISFIDMITIHLFESSDSKEVKVIKEMPNGTNNEISVKRSWSILINILQTEDINGFGSQFRPIPSFKICHTPSCLTWTLFSILSSCKDLWRVIDSKTTPFKSSGWEGWILTAIHSLCFQYNIIKADKRSPFKKTRNLSDIAEKVNNFIHRDLYDDNRDDGYAFYKYDINCIKCLFNENDYESNVLVVASFNEISLDNTPHPKIIITVGEDAPTNGSLDINENQYELQVICHIQANRKGRHTSDFKAIRYMRHGNGYNSWWQQERNVTVPTKCIEGEDIYNKFHATTASLYFIQYTCVYVRINHTNSDEWKIKFFESMGGNAHVRCQCCSFPLIPTHRHKEDKQKCNVKQYIDNDGVLQTKEIICQRPESLICCNTCCDVKICKTCYKNFSRDDNIILIPSTHTHNTDDVSNMEEEDDSITESVESDASSHESYDNNPDDDLANRLNNFMIYSEQDPTIETTEDNEIHNNGFLTTHSGDIATNIHQDMKTDAVSGHVIFNQAGSCTSRKRYNITGTNRQQHMVQKLCATVPGQASPLIQPEASLFPRHFYAAADKDPCSILGAQPIFLMNGKTHPYGFTSTLTQARIHMTNPFSTTSTDPNHMCFYFDQLGNKVLNSGHSRDVFQRGFVIDDKSPNGMSIRDKNTSELSGSIDSRQMVQNLAASQKYIKYTWFLTFTSNQSEHPGLWFLHQWKNSTEWTKDINDFDLLPLHDRKEIKIAMEQAYGNHVFNNWNTVKYMLLLHIKEHLTILGTVSAIFARDEYQKVVGNLCHNHLILAIVQSTMNPNAEEYIQKFLRTSVLEIIKTDVDLPRLIQNGLLKSEQEVTEVTERANKILRHKCDDRCKIRVGPGNSEKNFQCRKLHAVRDSPDPTKHNYVLIKYKFQKTTLDVLHDIGLYNIETGEFNHYYFQPKRHIAPCNFNAKCNMSPVIVDFFVALKSMMNAQVLEHTNGLAKYVVKYIGKFDEGNYVMLCQDIHTGQWVLGKTHLHNTKVVTSKFNEDKAFTANRKHNHPVGRDMPHFEIRQILLGHPEVFTNLRFIQISTLPFELRSSNKITLDEKGNITDNSHPSDNYNTNPFMHQIRIQLRLCRHQMMTMNQISTYKNHDGSSISYDMISLFSLRPPELLSVFTNPVDYYRICFIAKKKMKKEDIESSLNTDLSVLPKVIHQS